MIIVVGFVFAFAGCAKQDSKPSYQKTTYNYDDYEIGSLVLQISDVSLSWSSSSYVKCTGKVKNTGKKTYTFVKVKGAFKDSKGNVVDTDWTYVVGSEGLAPGESSSFSMSVKKDYSIESCSVTILDYD